MPRNPSNPSNPTRAPAVDARTVLRDALAATGRTQLDLAVGVLGIGLSTLTDGLAGRSANPLLLRLAWLLSEHPETADELEAAFWPE